MSVARTCAGVAAGSAASTSAAAPATCGAAIDVPLPTAIEMSDARPADMMDTPGANRSTQPPWLENGARASALSLAATVNASGALAGEAPHASALSLPAATAYVRPDAIDACTAPFSSSDAGPPMLMLTTAGRAACVVTQSTAAMTSVYSPQPSQPNARSATTWTALATPVPAPPIVPATWVP